MKKPNSQHQQKSNNAPQPVVREISRSTPDGLFSARAETARENIAAYVEELIRNALVKQIQEKIDVLQKQGTENTDAHKTFLVSLDSKSKNLSDTSRKLEDSVNQLYRLVEQYPSGSRKENDAGEFQRELRSVITSLNTISNSVETKKSQVFESVDALMQETSAQVREKLRPCMDHLSILKSSFENLIVLNEKLQESLENSAFIRNSAELRKALHDFASHEAEIADLQAENAMLSEQIADLKKQKTAYESENLALRTDANSREAQLQELRKTFRSCAEERDARTAALREIREQQTEWLRKETELSSQNVKLANDLNSEKEALKIMESRKRELEEQNAALSSELNSRQKEWTQMEIAGRTLQENLNALRKQLEQEREQQMRSIPTFLRELPLFRDLDCTGLPALYLRNSLVCLLEAEHLRADFHFNEISFWKQLELIGRYLNACIRSGSDGNEEQLVYEKMNETANKINEFAREIGDPPPFTLFLPVFGATFLKNAVDSPEGVTTAVKILNWGVKDSRNNYQVKARVG